MLQELVSIGHEVIRSSWTAASVLVKYYIFATFLFLAYRKDISIEKFQESLVENSRVVVLGLGALGIVLAAAGLEFSPVLPEASQVIALTYLGYLFWIY